MKGSVEIVFPPNSFELNPRGIECTCTPAMHAYPRVWNWWMIEQCDGGKASSGNQSKGSCTLGRAHSFDSLKRTVFSHVTEIPASDWLISIMLTKIYSKELCTLVWTQFNLGDRAYGEFPSRKDIYAARHYVTHDGIIKILEKTNVYYELCLKSRIRVAIKCTIALHRRMK